MSKVKLSLSFLLMFLLIGMFSSAAFATGTNGTPDPADPTTGIKASLASDDSVLDNGQNNVNQSGVGVGGQAENFANVIKSDGMIKDNSNTTGTHKTHGDYQNNTNSCASCHQTHTGASDNLLFKNGEYATCTACHDGTLGFFNVFSATGSDSAGTFGGTHDGNMSVHLANGTVKIKAAPGGKLDATDDDEVWGAEFSCASCHAPHGAYGDRLLNPNPNHMGNVTVNEGGKKLVGVPVVGTLATKDSAGDVNYNDLEGTAINANYVLYKSVLGASPAADYTAKGLVSGDTVMQLYKWDDKSSTYKAEKDPFLHGYDWDASHTNKIYWSVFYPSTGLNDPAADQLLHTDKVKAGAILGNGFIGAKAANATAVFPATIAKANIARSYVVDLDVVDDTNYLDPVVTKTNVTKLWDKTAWGETGATKSNKGVAMSQYCASCHTDYFAASTDDAGTGIHASAYRHSTNSDNYTCVRCHYAHGTDVAVMRDAQGKNMDQIIADTTYFPGVTGTEREDLVEAYLLDKNASSALKRYTNMSVCWGCHTSSHSEGTRNTSTYEYGSGSGATKDLNGLNTGY